jgi:arylsulfatase A-like enzyme
MDRIDRRTVIAGAAVSAASLSFAAVAKSPRTRRPNIVFIMADDLGAFDLSCYGRTDFQTPNIDRLARHGMKFTYGYANSSTCAPTRTALISGRYQNRFQIGTGWGGDYPSAVIGFAADQPSLPRTFKNAGYRTALIGKWDLGELPSFSPNKSGYDEFFGNMGGGIDYWTHDINALGLSETRKPDFYENETPVQIEGYATDLFTGRACEFIRSNASRPFLLSLHYTAPHWPWQTRNDKGKPRKNDFHYDGGSPAIFRDMVLAMDEGVGRVLDTLRALKLSQDTIIVFTSDNGGERFSKMWPLRGEKGDLWEGGIRVPLIVSWPGHVRAQTVTDQVAMSMDFLPTLAALAGIGTDPAFLPDGVDLSPQLKGGETCDRTIFWKTPGDMLSVLSFPWKYVRVGQREYLFDLSEDITENHNRKLKNPDIFSQLKVKAEAWSTEMLANLPMPPREMLDSMKALDPITLPRP